MHPSGSFGSSSKAPSSYHARGANGKLGFVCDIGKDGWNIGTPGYVGDYFVPGDPEEGWGIQWQGNTIADVDWVDLSMRSISDSAEFENGVISVALDAGELGRALVDFRITSDSPATVITLDPTTVLFIGASMDKMATFNSISGEFFIPTLTVPGGSGYKNLRFQLSDADSYSFTLQSFEQP